MAQFDDQHRFARVLMVDFEKTALEDRPLGLGERVIALRKLRMDMSESERSHFICGYRA